MESVLHIEPLHRPVSAPFTIGQFDILYYGDREISEENGDPLGEHAGHIRLGSPLQEMDAGSTRTHIPFVKTLECMPNATGKGFVYLDTVHYVADQQYLIPVRTKIHSGPSAGVRISHLPSLNHMRNTLTGDPQKVRGCYEEIVTNLLEHDSYFRRNQKHPVTEWIFDDLIHSLSSNPLVPISFSKDQPDEMVRSYIREVRDTPHELNARHLNAITRKISLVHETIPTALWSSDVVARPILDVKRRMVPHGHDFSSNGRLHTETLSSHVANHYKFQWLAEILDTVPLTDFNIDVVIDPTGAIVFYHENYAVNRFSVFADSGIGAEHTGTILQGIFTEHVLNELFTALVHYHPHLSDHNREVIIHNPIKLKIVKTICDEAAVVVFDAHSPKGSEPLCALSFDLALISLAPMTVVEEPITI